MDFARARPKALTSPMNYQFDSQEDLDSQLTDSTDTTPTTTENEPLTTDVLKSNTKAARQRHLRVFGTSSYLRPFILKIKKVTQILKHMALTLFKRSRRFASMSQGQVVVKDPFKTFVRQTVAIACSLFIITSLPPTHILETGFTQDYFSDTDFIDASAEPELDIPSFIINEEGFILKTTPVSEDSDRSGMNDMLKHTVADGDTLSGIAKLYGLSMKTILWENNISADSTLKIGQVLNIPPVDGVTHVVAEKGDTLESIAKKYGVEIEAIKTQNEIEGDVIAAGQKLFIPGGVLQQNDPVIVRTGIRSTGTRQTVNGRTLAKVQTYAGSVASDGSCGKMTFPTSGKVTQGFQRGHTAYDIGNVAKPDIWSSCAGTVVKVVTGCPDREVRVDRSCGGGYGNHVIIDHGDGVQTLYAHMGAVYVSVGQSVTVHQAVGQMSNSGRTYGSTGRHLHFEVRIGGQRRNPGNYL